jgi:hypothetical protein
MRAGTDAALPGVATPPPVLVLGGGARGFTSVCSRSRGRRSLKGIVSTSMSAGISAMPGHGCGRRALEALQRDLAPWHRPCAATRTRSQEHLLRVARRSRPARDLGGLNHHHARRRGLRLAFSSWSDVGSPAAAAVLAVTTDLATGEEVRLKARCVRRCARRAPSGLAAGGARGPGAGRRRWWPRCR